MKVGIAGKFTLPDNILSAQVKGEWGLSAKIGGNSSEIGTKIFFNAGTRSAFIGLRIHRIGWAASLRTEL